MFSTIRHASTAQSEVAHPTGFEPVTSAFGGLGITGFYHFLKFLKIL